MNRRRYVSYFFCFQICTNIFKIPMTLTLNLANIYWELDEHHVRLWLQCIHSTSNPQLSWVLLSTISPLLKLSRQDVHVVRRGGTKGLYFACERVRKAAETIEKKMIFEEEKFDCSRKFPLLSFCFLLIWSCPSHKIASTNRSSSPTFAINLQLARRTLLVSWSSQTSTKVDKMCPP